MSQGRSFAQSSYVQAREPSWAPSAEQTHDNRDAGDYNEKNDCNDYVFRWL